ncbi:MAG: glycosyltransferase family 39 protein [Alphaproteobacteria bacterium]|nr:glycosyltransferase family 39 protein [Alphaproteobacteria bacterium]
MSDAVSEPAPPPAPQPEAKGARFRRGLTRFAYPLLALLCLGLWLPGILSLPALDRDESRFAQSSRQMLDSGNFIDIRFGNEPRYKKPAGIYWAQAAATAVAGHVEHIEGDHSQIWTYRLPSLFGAIAAVWLTFWIGSAFGAEAGLLAALLIGFTTLLTAEATIATTDAVLLAATLVAMGVLMRAYRAGRGEGTVSPGLALLGWAGFAIAALVKGPVVVGVTGAAILALFLWDWWDGRRAAKDAPDTAPRWTSHLRWLKATNPLWGIALTFVVVAPWMVAIWVESHGSFFQQSLGHDFAGKLAGGQESHGLPPGYNLILSAVAFWPGILFVLPAIGLAVTRAKEPAIRFLLAWAGGFWLVCELVPTKLPQYVLPAYPALAILAGLWLIAARDDALPLWRRVLPYIASLQFLVGLAGLVAAPLILPRLYGAGMDKTLIAPAALAGLAGLGALIMSLRRARWTAMALGLLSLAIIVPTLTVGAGPRLTQLWVSERLAAKVARHENPNDPPPAIAGFQEPSLVFALGADVNLTDGPGAAKQGADQGGLALVDDFQRPAFLAHLAELQSDAVPVDELSGFNYSRGKKVHVTIYRMRKLTFDAPPGHAQTGVP